MDVCDGCSDGKVLFLTGNPIAGLIHGLLLEDGKMQLLLSDPSDADTDRAKVVEIDLSLTAYANVRNYYDTMKKVKDKKEKTLAVTDGVVGRATKKAEKSASEMKSKVTIQTIRKGERDEETEKKRNEKEGKGKRRKKKEKEGREVC